MNNIEIDDQNGLRGPNRKPWLWLIVAALVLVIALQHCLRSRPKEGADVKVATSMATQAVQSVQTASSKAPGPVQPAPVTLKTEPVAAPVVAAPATNSPSVTNRIAATHAVAPAANDVPRLLAEAKSLEDKADLVGVRGKLRDVLRQAKDPRLVTETEERIGKINTELALTPRLMPEKVDYVVQPGDSIEKIAKKFGTTIDLVQESNQLKNPDLIKAGDRLLVLTGKVTIAVSKTSNELLVRMGGQFFKRYRVGTGKFSKTPVGSFVVGDKQKEPVWWRPDGKEIPFGDRENILGTRWMSIRATGATADVKGYGIHGTWDESTIGKSESAGCIRMKNSDVEELYKFIPVNTPVTITE